MLADYLGIGAYGTNNLEHYLVDTLVLPIPYFWILKIENVNHLSIIWNRGGQINSVRCGNMSFKAVLTIVGDRSYDARKNLLSLTLYLLFDTLRKLQNCLSLSAIGKSQQSMWKG